MLILKRFSTVLCTLYIFKRPLESLYLFKKIVVCLKKIKGRWVVLKIYAYIGTDSGKRLGFILCYDYKYDDYDYDDNCDYDDTAPKLNLAPQPTQPP
jgi:hypothetical protein